MIVKVGAPLSRLAAHIVCGSEAAYSVHMNIGYQREKMTVIPNGFDVQLFQPSIEGRRSLRSELDIVPHEVLIGLIARFDPLKDHENFIVAAGEVARSAPHARFLLCGDGISRDNERLMRWIATAGIGDRVRLLGVRTDIARINSALDIACLSSSTEGFPNVIGEAMACGTPCVVTDVGDAAALVGDTGLVVPARNPQALANACLKLIDAGRDVRFALGRRARSRIEHDYSLATIWRKYEDLYRVIGTQRLPIRAPDVANA
jgi:glycosyltransferase involved in cell wall biosynthesis